jgi:hypothetical protein
VPCRYQLSGAERQVPRGWGHARSRTCGLRPIGDLLLPDKFLEMPTSGATGRSASGKHSVHTALEWLQSRLQFRLGQCCSPTFKDAPDVRRRTPVDARG